MGVAKCFQQVILCNLANKLFPMCNLETERKFHLPIGDDTLALELTLYVQSGPLLKLWANLTPTGVAWNYELGSVLTSGAGSVVTP